MAFGVKTANMFELLGDEDGAPAPSKPVAKAQAETKKSTAPELSGAANVEARMKGGAINGPTSNANGRGEGRGGGRGRGRGGRGFDRYREGGEGGEGGGDGERGPRPYRGRGGGGRHFERDNRRGYDRHDGTGRGHETEKKGGHGGHNWGAPGEEEAPVVEAPTGSNAVWQEEEGKELAAATDAPAAAEAAGETAPAEATEPAEPAEPTEPEKEEMTLAEYEKAQEEKRGSLKKKPTNVAKVDTKAFEGMKAYNPKEAKENKNDFELSDRKVIGKKKEGTAEKVRKEKELLPTGFRVGSNESGGRGRGRGDRGGRFNDRFGDRPERPPRRNDEEGGRGYGRGSGGRGDRPFSGGRGRGRDGPPPPISDSAAFPTLGA